MTTCGDKANDGAQRPWAKRSLKILVTGYNGCGKSAMIKFDWCTTCRERLFVLLPNPLQSY